MGALCPLILLGCAMNRLEFSAHLRGLLGRTYSVADEERGPDGALRLIVAKRGGDRALVIETVEQWFRTLPPSPSGAERVLIKHLAVCTRRFFDHPEYLPAATFAWPGTGESRAVVRLALDPRKWRRSAPRQQEEV